MEVVYLFVAADGIHIGKQALADVELVALQRQPLPLRKRMDDLRLGVYVGNVKTDRPLVAVQVIVQAGGLLHEQRRGHAAQIERVGQIRLEIALDEFDRALQFVDGQGGAVALWDEDLAHGEASLSYSVQKFTKYYTPNSAFMQVQCGNMQTFYQNRSLRKNAKKD